MMTQGIYKRLMDPLTYGITDSITKELSHQLSTVLTHQLVDQLRDGLNISLTEGLNLVLPDAVVRAVAHSVPVICKLRYFNFLLCSLMLWFDPVFHFSVNRLLPPTLVRGVSMVLTDIMTRNIVHTLAPVLTLSMGQPSIAKLYCYYCRYYGEFLTNVVYLQHTFQCFAHMGLH
jgi:hypothetical protein